MARPLIRLASVGVTPAPSPPKKKRKREKKDASNCDEPLSPI